VEEATERAEDDLIDYCSKIGRIKACKMLRQASKQLRQRRLLAIAASRYSARYVDAMVARRWRS
jgi:hypothetical protein